MARKPINTDKYTYLEQVLGDNGHELPKQKDVGGYLQKLRNVYREFAHPIPENPLLNEYFDKHRGIDRSSINLGSSATNFPPYEPAVRASAKAGETMDNTLHSKYNAAAEKGNAMVDEIQRLEHIHSQLIQLTPRDTDRMDPENMAGALMSILNGASKAEIEVAQNGMRITPEMQNCIRNCSDYDFMPKMPRNRDEQRRFMSDMLEFSTALAEVRLHGAHISGQPRLIGLNEAYDKVRDEIDAEFAKLPKGAALEKQLQETHNSSLRPAVVRLMESLQGIDPKTIKPENLTLVQGSSTHLMDVALDNLVKPSGRREPRKQLLLFSLSWDGLKSLPSEHGMDASIINGSVNAQALDDHIKTHILKGKFQGDEAGARAEVQKQVGAMIMNIPENPTGRIPSDDEMKALAVVIKKYEIPTVLVDEIFAAPGHRSLITYPGMENCYVISSTSKNMNTSAKMAYGYSHNYRIAKIVQGSISEQASMHPVQSISYGALLEETPHSYYTGNQEQYARKARLVTDTMSKLNKELGLKDGPNNGISWHEPPNYGCLGVITFPRELTDKAQIHNTCELAEYLYKLSGVKGMPTGDVNPVPGQPLGIRVNFSDDDHLLIEGVERLGVAMKHMQREKAFSTIEGPAGRGRDVGYFGSGQIIMGSISDIMNQFNKRDIE